MANRIIYIIMLLGLLTATSSMAQDQESGNWDTEKIKGTRHFPYPSYSGNPYLTDKFISGEIDFADGEKIEKLFLRYSTYRDEVIYFNRGISAQIVIDKLSISGFTLFGDDGTKRVFRQQYFNGFNSGNRFFEVLSDREITLLAYRSVVLQYCPVYNNEIGIVKNMEYVPSFNYYLYTNKDGYIPIKIGKNPFLSKFTKPNQKLVRKLLRQNKITIKDEPGMVKALELVEANRIAINF